MDFRKATDKLLASVTLADLAAEMGVSIQAVRQARVADGSSSYRAPPPDWERAARALARKAATRYGRLARDL